MTDIEQRIAHVELVVRNLVEGTSTQTTVFGALIRVLSGKGLLTEAEWRKTCEATLAALPPDLQKGVPGNTLRELANLLSVPIRH